MRIPENPVPPRNQTGEEQPGSSDDIINKPKSDPQPEGNEESTSKPTSSGETFFHCFTQHPPPNMGPIHLGSIYMPAPPAPAPRHPHCRRRHGTLRYSTPPFLGIMLFEPDYYESSASSHRRLRLSLCPRHRCTSGTRPGRSSLIDDILYRDGFFYNNCWHPYYNNNFRF